MLMIDLSEYSTHESQKERLKEQVELLGNRAMEWTGRSFPIIYGHLGFGTGLDMFVVLFAIVAVPVVFGLPHLLVWNATFPHHAELILWRIATVAVIASGAVAAMRVIPRRFGLLMDDFYDYSEFATLAFCHIISSLYLTVQSCRQLFFHQEKAPCRMILESVELCSNCEQIYSQYQYPQYSTVLKCSSKYYMILHDSTCILWPYYMSSIPIIRTYLFLTLLNFGG